MFYEKIISAIPLQHEAEAVAFLLILFCSHVFGCWRPAIMVKLQLEFTWYNLWFQLACTMYVMLMVICFVLALANFSNKCKCWKINGSELYHGSEAQFLLWRLGLCVLSHKFAHISSPKTYRNMPLCLPTHAYVIHCPDWYCSPPSLWLSFTYWWAHHFVVVFMPLRQMASDQQMLLCFLFTSLNRKWNLLLQMKAEKKAVLHNCCHYH